MTTRTLRLTASLTTATASSVCLAAWLMAAPAVQATGSTLPLGAAGLAEVRTTQTLAPGVALTDIVRGSGEASPETIGSTARGGPWHVEVLSIDPRTARGRLSTTYGVDIAHTERTTDLVRAAGALAGVRRARRLGHAPSAPAPVRSQASRVRSPLTHQPVPESS